MKKQDIAKYASTYTESWKVFKMLLENYKPTEDYMDSCVKWMGDMATSDDFFRANIAKVCLAEIFRLMHKESAGIDLLMLANAARVVADNYGIEVKIRIKDKGGIEREMMTEEEAAG